MPKKKELTVEERLELLEKRMTALEKAIGTEAKKVETSVPKPKFEVTPTDTIPF